MQFCPSCQQRYADGMKFCVKDGTSLKPFVPAGDPRLVAPEEDPLLGRVLDGRYRILTRICIGDGNEEKLLE